MGELTQRDRLIVLATCDTLNQFFRDEVDYQLDRKMPNDVGGFVGSKINQQVTIDTLRFVIKRIDSLRAEAETALKD